MGGDVTVLSTLGEGSAFTLELPLEAGQATPEMGFAAAPALVASTVLVAEDDAALRRLIGMQLERLGVQPTLVEHGQAAVEAISRPVLRRGPARPAHAGDGRAAKRRRRSARSTTRCRCSRSPPTRRPRTSELCRAAGMDGHLAKPISLPALRTELDRRITPVLDDSLFDELADNLGGPRSWTRCWPSTTASSRAGSRACSAASTPEELRDAAHALRSPSAGFGIARLASRLRRVEAAARKGTMAPLELRLRHRGARRPRAHYTATSDGVSQRESSSASCTV